MRQQAKKMNVTNLRSNEANEQRAEIRIAKTAIANVSLWLTCWAPYAIITMQGVSGNFQNITPLVTMLPALLAMTEHMSWFCVHEAAPKANDNKSNTTVANEKE